MVEINDNQEQPENLGLLTLPEASAYMNITESMLRSMVFKRKIPVIRIGRCLRFSKADLTRWLSKMKSEGGFNE